MKLSIPSTLAFATLLAVPTASAWSCGPGGGCGYGVVVRPGLALDTFAAASPRQMRRRQRELWNRQQELFDRATNARPRSVRYQIIDNENEFKVSIDVPGVKPQDIDVGIEDNGKVLSVSGQREKEGESGTYTVTFSESFAVDDETVDIEKFSANLKNGVLVVTAPKILERIQDTIRKIPIIDPDAAESTSSEDVPETDVVQKDQQDVPVVNVQPEVDATSGDDAKSGGEGEEKQITRT